MCRKRVYLASLVLLLGLVGNAWAVGDVIPIQTVTAADEGLMPVINTVNGSGMTGDLHDNSYSTLWLTAVGANGGGDSNPHPGTYNPGPGFWTWIKVEFDDVYSLGELWVWNYNEYTTRGLRNVVIEYTSDGTNWNELGQGHTFAKAPDDGLNLGLPNYAHNTTINFNGVQASAVIITTEEGLDIANWGDTFYILGLSEIRFHTFVQGDPNASTPNPGNGVSNVVSTAVLSWSPGSGAVSHNVYLGTDPTPDSGEFKGNQTETTYEPPGGLELGQEYFWRIDEVDGDSNVWPGEVWSFTVNLQDPQLAQLRRGLTLDRQYLSVPSTPVFLQADIQMIKSMGFDHVKLLVNPQPHKSGNGINSSSMWYLDAVVNLILDEGLSVLVCIHPEHAFKMTILRDSPSAFQDMLGFYEEFAAYMAARWGPEELVFQLMTEPGGTSSNPAAWNYWNTLLPQIWQAARNGMPDHTLMLSGDRYAIIDALIQVVPVDDDNVIYNFGFYEPFIFTFSGGVWVPANNYIRYLQHVPWPSNPTVISNRMSDMIANVPPSYQGDAQDGLTTYGDAYWSKDYMYNMRLQMALNWAENHGGLKLYCHEWGVYHGTTYPDERLQFIRDAREVFEENGVTWAYWSYNETQTILNNNRVPWPPVGTPNPAWIDNDMLNALGLLCGEGDINCDNVVDEEDLVILVDQWLQAPDYPPYADIAPGPDGDGIADFLDFSVVGKHWMEDVTPY